MKKMKKVEANYWRKVILAEVSENDGIGREELIRRIYPHLKKGQGKYQKLYWFIGNMIRNGELVPKKRGLTILSK